MTTINVDLAFVTLPFRLILAPIFFTADSNSCLCGRVGVGGGTRHWGPSESCTSKGLWVNVGKLPNDGKAISFESISSPALQPPVLLLLLLLLNLPKPTKWLEKLGWCSQEFLRSRSCRNFDWTGLSVRNLGTIL